MVIIFLGGKQETTMKKAEEIGWQCPIECGDIVTYKVDPPYKGHRRITIGSYRDENEDGVVVTFLFIIAVDENKHAIKNENNEQIDDLLHEVNSKPPHLYIREDLGYTVINSTENDLSKIY